MAENSRAVPLRDFDVEARQEALVSMVSEYESGAQRGWTRRRMEPVGHMPPLLFASLSREKLQAGIAQAREEIAARRDRQKELSETLERHREFVAGAHPGRPSDGLDLDLDRLSPADLSFGADMDGQNDLSETLDRDPALFAGADMGRPLGGVDLPNLDRFRPADLNSEGGMRMQPGGLDLDLDRLSPADLSFGADMDGQNDLSETLDRDPALFAGADMNRPLGGVDLDSAPEPDWMWELRLNNAVTSVSILAEEGEERDRHLVFVTESGAPVNNIDRYGRVVLHEEAGLSIIYKQGDGNNYLEARRAHLEKELRSGRTDFVDYDFSHMDLRGLDLSGLDLRGANLTGADAQGVSFQESDMSHADLQYVDAENADFSCTRLQEANMSNMWAGGANFRGALMAGSTVSSLMIDGADCRDAAVVDVDFARTTGHAVSLDEDTDFGGSLVKNCRVTPGQAATGAFADSHIQGGEMIAEREDEADQTGPQLG